MKKRLAISSGTANQNQQKPQQATSLLVTIGQPQQPNSAKSAKQPTNGIDAPTDVNAALDGFISKLCS